jgi:glycosyltransferase involved in cell wall biosynthesis
VDIALLAEGTYPYKAGGVSVWCDQLIRGLADHTFTVHAITPGDDNQVAWDLPDNVVGVRSVPLWGAAPAVRPALHRPAEVQSAFGQLARSLTGTGGEAEFVDALHQMYQLSREMPMAGSLRSKQSLQTLLAAMREAAPSGRAFDGVGPVTVHDASQVLDHLDHLLRPLWAPTPEADLCHASANGLSVLMALGAHWAHQTPLVLSEHGIYLRERYFSYAPDRFSFAVRSLMLRFYKHLAWAGYQIADSIAPVCEYNRRWQLANGAAPERVRPIYNGVDPDHFWVSDEEPDEPTLVWMGRIGPLKDVETLLEAFALVRKELPTAQLRMYGGVHEENQAYFEDCRDLRERLGLTECATFEGQTDAVVEAYHTGHVVVLTSISEGFPYTLIEAMASGKATVSTDVGGVAEASGDAGLVVPPQDPVRFAEACVRLLTDAEYRRSMGEAARARVLDKFTLEQNLSAYGEVYRQLARPRPETRVAPSAAESPAESERARILSWSVSA